MDPDGGGSASADGPKTDFAGVRLDEGYVLIERLGVGRVGELWEASAPEGPSNVGIQLLLPALSRSGRHVRRFLSAARAGATLQHSNIVPVMNCGQVPNGPVYLARELLDGVRLRRVLAERGGLSWARAKPLLLQMLEAIEVAHADGVVHGGLEPARCWLVGDGEPESSTLKVTGFTLFGGAGSPWPLDKPYRAPELDDEETEPDTSTDVYAAGTVAYEMLSGMEWSGEAVTKTAGLCEIVPDVPPRVDRVIARALNLDRTRRYPDGKTLLAAFRRAAGVKPPPAAKTAAPKVAPPAPRAPVASPILGPIAATYESPESTLASEAAAVEAMQRSNAPASSEAAPGRALDRGPSAGEGFPPFDGGPLPSPQLAPPSAALLGRPAAAGPAAVGPDYGALSRGPVSEPSVPATPHYPTPALSRPLPAAPQRPLGHQPLGQPTPSVQQQPSHAQSRPQPRVQQPLGQPTPSVQQHGVSQQPNPMLSTPQPLGQQPLGQQPLGQQPLGQQPLGQQPLGQQPLGQQPLGQPTPSVSQQPSPAHSRPTPSVPQRAVSQQPSPAPSVPPPSVEHTTRPMPSPPMTQPPRPSIPSRPGTSELSRRGTSATPGAPAAPIRAPGSLGRLGASALGRSGPRPSTPGLGGTGSAGGLRPGADARMDALRSRLRKGGARRVVVDSSPEDEDITSVRSGDELEQRPLPPLPDTRPHRRLDPPAGDDGTQVLHESELRAGRGEVPPPREETVMLPADDLHPDAGSQVVHERTPDTDILDLREMPPTDSAPTALRTGPPLPRRPPREETSVLDTSDLPPGDSGWSTAVLEMETSRPQPPHEQTQILATEPTEDSEEGNAAVSMTSMLSVSLGAPVPVPEENDDTDHITGMGGPLLGTPGLGVPHPADSVAGGNVAIRIPVVGPVGQPGEWSVPAATPIRPHVSMNPGGAGPAGSPGLGPRPSASTDGYAAVPQPTGGYPVVGARPAHPPTGAHPIVGRTAVPLPSTGAHPIVGAGSAHPSTGAHAPYRGVTGESARQSMRRDGPPSTGAHAPYSGVTGESARQSMRRDGPPSTGAARRRAASTGRHPPAPAADHSGLAWGFLVGVLIAVAIVGTGVALGLFMTG